MTSYSRYSHHARRALSHASALVTRYRHPGIDTGHLLVGVMLTEGSIGYLVLNDLNLSVERAEPHLRALFPALAELKEHVSNEASLDAALQLAADESSWLGNHYIGTEHLLLGITRTNVGAASTLLQLLGVTPEDVRRQVRRVLSDGLTEFNLQFAKRSARLSELSRRVINAAEQMAVTFDHPTIGLGHLLLVLLMEQRSLTSSLLRESGLDEAALRAGLRSRDVDLLVSVEQALRQALDVAERLGDHYTGTEHLLLMLAVDPAGITILQKYGLSPDVLLQRLAAHLSHKP